MAFPQLLTYWFRRSWTFTESLEMQNAKFWNQRSLDFEVSWSWIINMGTFFNSQFSAHKYMGEWKGLLISGNFLSFSSHYLPVSQVDWITCHFHKMHAFCASYGACFFSCGDLISSPVWGKPAFSSRPAEMPFLIRRQELFLSSQDFQLFWPLRSIFLTAFMP